VGRVIVGLSRENRCFLSGQHGLRRRLGKRPLWVFSRLALLSLQTRYAGVGYGLALDRRSRLFVRMSAG